MSELQERFQRWADELVDLTARNELINFKVTKTSTILPDPKGLSKLLNGDTVAITDLCDLTDPDQMKPAKGAIKTAKPWGKKSHHRSHQPAKSHRCSTNPRNKKPSQRLGFKEWSQGDSNS